MFKNFILFFVLLFLCNCAAPGTALLGPAITGASTKSLGQASISFGTNQIVRKIHEASKKSKKEVKKIVKKIEDFNLNSINKKLLAYKVTKIEISEVLEPEPLP